MAVEEGRDRQGARVGHGRGEAVVQAVGARPDAGPGQLLGGRDDSAEEQLPQQPSAASVRLTRGVLFRGPVAVDHMALDRVAVLLHAQDHREECPVGDSGGAAAVHGDLHGAGERGLHAPQHGGHRDPLDGTVGAQQQGGGEVLFVDGLDAVEGGEPRAGRQDQRGDVRTGLRLAEQAQFG